MSDMIFLDTVDSTNTYLKERRDLLSDGAAVTARLQTAGRGRLGRAWLADDGMLPLSVLLKNPENPSTVTLCAGVSVCEALENAFPTITAEIKWPNDIIVSRRKVCGILCESVCIGEKIDVICGIGVNLTQTAEFFAERGLPHGASLKMLTGEETDRKALAEDIADRVTALCRCGFSRIYEQYRKRCITLGKQVRLINSGSERTAFAEDIAENGFLVCTDENGQRLCVNSGEVSVRGLMDYV